MKTYLALIRNDIRLAFRQKVVIFFNYLMPLTFFFIFAQAFHAEQGGAILQVVTMVTVIGILGNGFIGAGMRAVQDRETNILRRYKVAPISPLPMLVASTITGLVIYIPYVVVMLALAKARYGMQMPRHSVAMLLFIVLGVVALRAIGLILSSVVNSMAEAQILVQIAYMAMLFLSGTTFPTTLFPAWLLTATQFIPSTWLVTGLQGIMIRNETLLDNWQAVGALLLTTVIGLFISVKIFRWEKEEKMRPAAKLWVVAVLLPFLALGTWQTYAKDNVAKARLLDRDLARSRSRLIRNARIFVGDGTVIENGAVLVKDGRIAEIYEGSGPDPKSVNAEAIEGAGKTVLPGLIDMHVLLGMPGGVLEDPKKYDPENAMTRALAAYLFSGVTAVRNAGDATAPAVKARDLVDSAENEGAQLFLTGSVADSHDVREVEEALRAGTKGIERGSWREKIPDADFELMAKSGVTYDPMLSFAEVMTATPAARLELMGRSLVQQVAPKELLAGTRKLVNAPAREAADMNVARHNLVRAYLAGVTLIAGSDAGNAMLFHGPAVQHELALWVDAGVPAKEALRAATLNAARALGADARFGSITKGKEATLVVVNGNPLQDIRALELVSIVMQKGEYVDRAGLLKAEPYRRSRGNR